MSGLPVLLLALAMAADPAFDAVSVKAVQADTNQIVQTDKGLRRPAYRWFQYTAGRVTCALPLISIISEAYEVKLWQISGPAWLDDGVYELAAVMPADTPRAQARQMLRTMLRERFQMKGHMETRDVPVYALTVGKSGARLAEASSAEPATKVLNPRELRATQISIRSFSEWVTGIVPRPIVDQTGLEGSYDVDLKWTPDFSDPTDVHSPDMGLLNAIEEQLGLKLTAVKMPCAVLVVDQAQRIPTSD